MNHKYLTRILAILLLGIVPAWSQVPQLVNFQGRVAVDGVNFNGQGLFKIAIVNPDRSTTLWSNDGTSTNGLEPTDAVKLDVTNGLYSVLLGDATQSNMTVLPASVFNNENLWVRVWFDDGSNGSQLLTPDQRLAAVGYALMAAGVENGAITSSKLAPNSVNAGHLQANSVTSSEIQADAVGAAELAANAVGTTELTNGAVQLADLNLTDVDSRYVLNTGDLVSDAKSTPILLVENTARTGTLAKAIEATIDSASANASAIHGIVEADPAGGLSAGLRGENRGTSASGIGIYGSHAGSGWGLYGNATGTTGSGSRGVYGRSNSDGGRGVYGFADAATGTTYGVYGDADSPNGYGGYFTNTGVGSGVGLYARGGNNTAADIVLGGNDDGRILSDPAYASSDIFLLANDGIVLQLDNDNGAEDHDLEVKRGDGSVIMNIDDSGWTDWRRSDGSNILSVADSGWTHWDRADGTQLLEVHSNGTVEFFGPTGTEYAQLREDASEGGGELLLRFPDGSNAVVIEAAEVLDDGAQIALFNSAGQQTLTLDAEQGSGAPSRVITGTVQITGGSDLSEQFAVLPSACIEEPEPGMIVCIDPDHPGQLIPSSRSYDRTVAGIISGAGGIRTGMLMGQQNSVADGEHPIALTGRVYCMMDARNGAIQPGDLITTSDTPGHGMKVTNHDQARGAIIGKAMTRLEEGTGLVLVLVSLQ